MVLPMFQESPNLEIYWKEQEIGCLPLKLCLCRSFFFTSVAVTDEVAPKALHSHIRRLCAAESTNFTKHICKEDPQCVMFSTPEASQIFQNLY